MNADWEEASLQKGEPHYSLKYVQVCLRTKQRHGM